MPWKFIPTQREVGFRNSSAKFWPISAVCLSWTHPIFCRSRLNLVKVLLHFILLKIVVQHQLPACPHTMLPPWRYRIELFMFHYLLLHNSDALDVSSWKLSCSHISNFAILIVATFFYCTIFCSYSVPLFLLTMFSDYIAKKCSV
jgi:hypothetical protein